jgi:hypothetical protein
LRILIFGLWLALITALYGLLLIWWHAPWPTWSHESAVLVAFTMLCMSFAFLVGIGWELAGALAERWAR